MANSSAVQLRDRLKGTVALGYGAALICAVGLGSAFGPRNYLGWSSADGHFALSLGFDGLWWCHDTRRVYSRLNAGEGWWVGRTGLYPDEPSQPRWPSIYSSA